MQFQLRTSILLQECASSDTSGSTSLVHWSLLAAPPAPAAAGSASSSSSSCSSLRAAFVAPLLLAFFSPPASAWLEDDAAAEEPAPSRPSRAVRMSPVAAESFRNCSTVKLMPAQVQAAVWDRAVPFQRMSWWQNTHKNRCRRIAPCKSSTPNIPFFDGLMSPASVNHTSLISTSGMPLNECTRAIRRSDSCKGDGNGRWPAGLFGTVVPLRHHCDRHNPFKHPNRQVRGKFQP